MTIAERKAREAYDLTNPWRPMCEAKPDGTVCELMFADLVGNYEADVFRYFLDHDGNWVRIDPPGRIYSAPMNWRPAFAKLTPERRHYLRKQADQT
ncbi:MAG: hypothetical protein BGN87_18370 [Rhizobiales bacterium 65-79]|nr:hypothetical protein [Hyphomicrobiales bacterium]OJU03570.1 MAG: hypothetical protein BGN87_18370 [Rhizobiales bacterium 65-79]